ncbi:MAG TPA: carboxypeptidase-like regulatory domain-containing protein [Vicinamibacterales bacterium]|nr:carboxypeptidase-like regulatory domain-containing protein [Vicinamibacterales bacterium]
MTTRLPLIVLLAALTIAAAPAAQQTSRDTPGAVFGTAAISGTLVTDDDDKRPIRRAIMSLNAGDPTRGRMAITDDQGRFTFPDLPAGKYTLSGARPAYVNAYYGARQSWRGPASPIVLADGQQLTVAMRMTHGAVVAGTLFDSLGRPQPNARVMAVQFRMVAGERQVQVQLAGNFNGQTDDRGTYRIYGLPPGEYAIAASIQGNPDLRQITPAEIQWAQQQIQRGGQATPGGASPWLGGPPPAPGPSIGYAPMFYPGTADPGAAALVTLGRGEVREGVDFPMQFVATSHIDGTIVDADGRPATAAILNLIAKRSIPLLMPMGGNSSRTDNSGKFSFAGVLPGDYTLVARAQTGPAPARGGGPSARPMLWAQQDLSVAGGDLNGLSLRLQPGLSISGRVAFDGTAAPPPDLTRIRVSLGPAQNGGTSVLLGDPQMNADGTFTFQGATPGRYRVGASVPQGPGAVAVGATAVAPAPTWWLKSVVYNGVDTLDSALEISNADLSGIVITFTDRPTNLSGRLIDAAGRAATDYWVVAFPSTRELWAPNSRRIRTARPDIEGEFEIAGLPPGDYGLVALTDLDQADLSDPAFLEQLAAASVKIALADGEKKKQDLKLSGGSPD